MRPFLALALLAACGPSTSQVERSKSVVYQADFALVWNAVLQAVKLDYKDIKFEDATKGVVQTDWHPIERGGESVDQDQTLTETEQEALERERSRDPKRSAAKLFRVRVEVGRGGPPWRVKITGEAARYEPGMTMLIPYSRGAADEPVWVQPRIDRLYVAIYERLDKYAIETDKPPPDDVARKTFDTSAWPNLPSDAQRVLGEIRAACARKDANGVRPHMSDPFGSSVGAVPADQTVAIWTADSTELGVLQAALDKGCDLDAAAERITCPKGGAPGLRAVLQKTAGVWKLAQLAE
jgi:hypothetical protein